MDSKKQDSFCLAPWTHAYASSSGERRLCCVSEKVFEDAKDDNQSIEQYWNSPELKSVRKQMLSGQRVSQCTACQLTEIGGNALRNHYNSKYAHHVKNVLLNTEADGHYSTLPVSFDYRSATCNFKCRMCDPGNSTSWRLELKANGLNEGSFPKNAENAIYEELLAAASAGNIEEIYWAGGEPLILPKHWQIMDQLIATGKAKSIDVRYNTNLSHIEFQKKNILDVVEHFKKTEIYLSLDAIGSIGEYLRTGLKWNQWVTNFEFLVKNKSEKVRLIIDCTLTLPGILVIEEFLQFFNKYNVEVSAKPVLTYPKDIYISPQVLPDEIFQKFMTSKVNSILRFESRFNTGFFRAMHTYLKMDTFQKQYNVDYNQAVATSKKWALKLDDIRAQHSQTSISEIYQLDNEVGQWWNSIAPIN